VLEAAVAQLAQAVEEDGAGQGVAGLALAESGLDAAAQVDVLQMDLPVCRGAPPGRAPADCRRRAGPP
jgi:hypothetical protein